MTMQLFATEQYDMPAKERRKTTVEQQQSSTRELLGILRSYETTDLPKVPYEALMTKYGESVLETAMNLQEKIVKLEGEFLDEIDEVNFPPSPQQMTERNNLVATIENSVIRMWNNEN